MLCIFPIEFICVSLTILTHNSDYFPKEHPSFSLKGNSVVREAGTKIFIFNAVTFRLQVAVGRRTLTAEFRV